MNKMNVFMILILSPLPVYAYIGPGMAGGTIAIVFGFIAAIFLAIMGILYYPIKRFLKIRKEKKATPIQKQNGAK